VNKVLLTGRLTRDPEFRALAGGTNVTTFAVATNEYRGNGKERGVSQCRGMALGPRCWDPAQWQMAPVQADHPCRPLHRRTRAGRHRCRAVRL
jgi:Single-strand binding protein family